MCVSHSHARRWYRKSHLSIVEPIYTKYIICVKLAHMSGRARFSRVSSELWESIIYEMKKKNPQNAHRHIYASIPFQPLNIMCTSGSEYACLSVHVCECVFCVCVCSTRVAECKLPVFSFHVVI